MIQNNKGITLISLIVYIIVFTTVIGTVAMITNYFTKNSEQTIISSNGSDEYTVLTSYIVKDVESEEIKDIKIKDEKILDIKFADESRHIYEYDNNNIYYISINKDNIIENKIIICKNTSSCSFAKNESNVSIVVTVNNITYNNKYTIKIADTD